MLLTCDHTYFEGKLGACLAKRPARHRFRRAVDFEDDATRTDVEDVALHVALSGTHAYFRGLLRERTIWEDAGPDFCSFPGSAVKRTACGFELVGSDARLRRRLEAECAECDGGTAGLRLHETGAAAAAGLPPAMLCFLRRQHMDSIMRAACRTSLSCPRRYRRDRSRL